MKKFLKVLGAVFSVLLVTAIVFESDTFRKSFERRKSGSCSRKQQRHRSEAPGEVENPSSLWMKLRRRFLKSVSLQHAKEITP